MKINVVLTKNPSDFNAPEKTEDTEVHAFGSIDELVNCYLKNTSKPIFIIGGATIYTQFLEEYSEHINTVYTTEVYNVPKTVEYSSFFPIKRHGELFKRESVSEFRKKGR